MKTLATDKNNNPIIHGSSLFFRRDLPAVMQSCEQAAQTLLGELVFNSTRGVSWRESVWEHHDAARIAEHDLLDILISVPGVTLVREVVIDISDDVARYHAIIVTEYGEEVMRGAA